ALESGGGRTGNGRRASKYRSDVCARLGLRTRLRRSSALVSARRRAGQRRGGARAWRSLRQWSRRRNRPAGGGALVREGRREGKRGRASGSSADVPFRPGCRSGRPKGRKLVLKGRCAG